MTADQVKQRLVNEIKLRGYDDKYVDRNEEREILQVAIQMGVAVETARSTLSVVCSDLGYVLESAVLQLVRDQLAAAMENDGLVDRGEFDRAVEATKIAMKGLRTDRQVKLLLVTMMEDTGNNKVKVGWFSNWYNDLKKELGVG